MRVLVFGANGPTGRQVVAQALAAGHTVRAVTRRPAQFPLQHPDLEVVRGDATDAASVDQAVRDQDAVVSALGVPYSRKPISLYSASTELVVAAMGRHGVRRLVVITSANVEPHPRGRFFVDHVVEPFLTRVIGRTTYADMRQMEALITASDLDWTIVRPPALADGDRPGPYQVAEQTVPGMFATRPDVAAFLLSQLDDDRFSRKVAAIVSPYARPSLLKIIWTDGIRKR